MMEELTVLQLLEQIREDQAKPESERRLGEDEVQLSLEAALEARKASPFLLDEEALLKPFDAVPVPMAIWRKVSHLPAWTLGLTYDVLAFLEERRITTVGTLLLHAEEVLTKEMADAQREDLQDMLALRNLRLPSQQELRVAKAEGFWVNLPDKGRPSWPLRVARCDIATVDTQIVAELSQTSAGFYKYAGLLGLGEVLSYGADRLREAWVDYALATKEGTELRHAADNAVRQMLERYVRPDYDLLIEWIQALNQELAT